MSETEIHVSQIFPSVTAYQLIGTNSATTGDVYLTLAGTSNEIIVTPSGTTITLSTPQPIAITSSPTFASLTLTSPLTVPNGGTGDSSLTAYAVLTGGTTSTGAVQSVSGVGTTGQVLTSNGASTLPTWQTSAASGTVNSGTAGQLAYYPASTNAVSGFPLGSVSQELRINSSLALQWTDNVVNVKDYGAKGDGVTNDTTAIQNAINSLSSLEGEVFFPAGTYQISAAIQLIYGISLKGVYSGNSGMTGTQINQTNSGLPVFLYVNTSAGPGSGEFQSSCIDGFQLNGGLDCLYAQNGGVNMTLRNLACSGYSRAGLHLRGFVQNLILEDVLFNSPSAGYGIYLAENGLQANNVSVGTTILFDKNWFHNLVFNGGLNGIHIDLLSGHTGSFNTFINTVVQAIQNDGIVLKGSLTNICFTGMSTETIGLGGPTFAQSTVTTISGNASVTVASGTNFVNGQTVTIRGAGTNGVDWYSVISSGGGTTTLVMTTTAPTSVTSQDITNGLYADVVLAPGTGAPGSNSPIAVMFQNYIGSTNGRTRYSVDCSDTIGGTTFIGCSLPKPIYDPFSVCSIFGQEFIQTINAQNYDGIQIFGPSFPCGAPSSAQATFLGTPLGRDLCLGLTDSAGNGTGTFGKFTFRKAATSGSTAAPQVASIDANGNMTLTGSLTFSTSTDGIVGTTTNDSAASGNVGEYIVSTVSQGSALTAGTTGQFKNITSITLTAGDWDVSGNAMSELVSSAVYTSENRGAISLNSGNTSTGDVNGYNIIDFPNPTVLTDSGASIPRYRVSVTGSTIVYLKVSVAYSAGPPTIYGTISARRMR